MSFLPELVHNFAVALKAVDSRAPRFTSRTGRVYQPGIGPHSEDRAVDLIVSELRTTSTAYDRLRCRAPYDQSRQSCDLVLGEPAEWMIEVKMARLLGDNGKPDDTAIKDVLSPFPSDRSAVTDCMKLVAGGKSTRLAVLIYGFMTPDKDVVRLMEAFEAIARIHVSLGERQVSRFTGLVHPVHRDGAVFGWEVSRKP